MQPADEDKRRPRSYRVARCTGCRVPKRWCFCDRISRVDSKTEIVIAMHFLEQRRTSNTAWLAARALERCSIVLRGIKNTPFDASTVAKPPPGGSTLLLYATENARPLDQHLVQTMPRPIKLVVPDGTWGQTRRMLHREPELRGLPAVRVASGPASIYRLRRSSKPYQLCTLEAIARALGALECSDIEHHLMEMLAAMVEAGMATRGFPART